MPFDVPNSFDGLLDHLQSHLEERYHVDMPDGKHEEFDETEFEHHLAQHGEISTEMESIMKTASRRKGPFLFDSCPFCGGYPDVVKKRFPSSDTLEAQKALRKHIKQHMQDIAFFLPPYREDILDEDDDLKSSAVTGQSASAEDFEDLGEFSEICGKKDCDCSNRGRSITDILTDGSIAVTSEKHLEDMDARIDIITPALGYTDPNLWKELFPNSAVYDRSPVLDEYFLRDEHLRLFIVPLHSPQIHGISPSMSEVAEDLSEHGLLAEWQAFQDCMSSLAVSKTNTGSNRFYLIAKGTCEWVFRHKIYLDWVARHHTLLWIVGRPGSGKSTLLNRILATHRSKTTSGVCDVALSFSFRDNGIELQNTRLDFYQSFLYQILEQAPDVLPELISTSVRRCKQDRETGEAWQWDPDELKAFIVMALSRICQSGHVWLFIDSLEACGEENAGILTNDFKGLMPQSSARSSANLHICLTCQSHQQLDPNHFLQINPENENHGDMAIYIQDQIPEGTLNATNIMAFIIEKAHGIFTFTVLLVRKVLELERKRATAQAIEEELESIGPAIELYHNLIAKRGSLSWSLETIYTIDKAIAQLLIDEDAEIWFKRALGQTPLSWAVERGYQAAVKLLLDKDAKMEFELSLHATPMTPSTTGVAEDGNQSPPIQIYSVPRDLPADLGIAQASPVSTSALNAIYYNHFAQESNPQQSESSDIRTPGTMADHQGASDQRSVQLDGMRKQTPSRNRSMESEAVKECFLCKAPFASFQARHRCRACGLFFDSKCTAVISTPNGHRKQRRKEDGVIIAREVLGPLLISVLTVQFLLPRAHNMSRREWEVIKTIIEKNARARDDLKYFADLLEREERANSDGNEAEEHIYSGSLRGCKSCFDVISVKQSPRVLPAFLSLLQQGAISPPNISYGLCDHKKVLSLLMLRGIAQISRISSRS